MLFNKDYEVNIGIEVHVQLITNSKIFCRCPNSISIEPNINICPICSGQPGVLPVLNKKVIEQAVKLAIATNSQISKKSDFARKHYFYPDLPKNYQITQFDSPICSNGYIEIKKEDGTKKKIRLIRIHIEEDAGKNIHLQDKNESFVDLNRAGTPLLEIVSHPDISSSYEAKEYLKALRLIVQYLNICTGNMEEGAFRADTNISVRKKNDIKLGTKCELKNINSFKFIADAIDYEIERQISILESGGTIKQETRLWDTKNHKTIVMREKDKTDDYRYMYDPDLPIIQLTDENIESFRKSMNELPEQRFNRLIANGLLEYEAEILINEPELANYYDETLKYTKSKNIINWILRDILGFIKENKIDIKNLKFKPEYLAELVELTDKNIINNKIAQEVFKISIESGKRPKDIVKENNLQQLDNEDEIKSIILDIIKMNPKQVKEYKSGKEKLFGFFVGQVMQKTKGKANPDMVNKMIKDFLSK